MRARASIGNGPRALAAVFFLLLAVSTVLASIPAPDDSFTAPSITAQQSDARAIAIAEQLMEKMGGQEAWNNTRYIRWSFFGRRTHYWDKWTGNHRIESDGRVVLFNANTREGRAWQDKQEIIDPTALAEALEEAYGRWINDTYWMFMPYKLLDPGVTLAFVGEQPMADGRSSEVLQLTFESVGLTPQNRYLVFVASDTGLVEQWSYFRDTADTEPGFTAPWENWQQFGNIMLATGHGRDADWEIAVFPELPASVFENPDPVQR